MTILSAQGQSWVEIGGDRCWREPYTKGDINVSFQWIDMGGKEPQACMVLYPAVRKLDGAPYAIPQENAWEYVGSNGKPTPYLLTSAFNAAQAMGFFADQSTVFRIVDIIVDGLPDFLRMPSTQPAQLDIKRLLHGIEATARLGGRVVHQEVL